MKKNRLNYKKAGMVIAIGSVIACSIAWAVPSFTPPEHDKSPKTDPKQAAVQGMDSSISVSEDSQLIQQLERAGMISEVKGFVVEKRQGKLFIDHVQQPDDVAGKYISTLKTDVIRVEVYPFMERLRQHPEAGLMQLLLPVMFSSPCVDRSAPKPGC